MSLGSLAHKFTVESVNVSDDTSTRINIKKRRENIVYRSISNSDNINIAYLAGTDSNADNNLAIADRSTSLTQNRIVSSTDIYTTTGSSFTLSVEEFLITDQFTEESPTQPSEPLFYQHTLANFNSLVTDFDDKTLVNIEFADADLNAIQLSTYILGTDILGSYNGKLYNNINNIYNSDTSETDITFVKYTVKTVSGTVTLIENFHELINNKPVFELAEFDDLDALGVMYPDRDVYLAEESSGSFLITMSRSGTYAYRELPESRIKVLGPALKESEDPWYLRVTNGHFLTSLLATSTTYRDYEYKIAEFNNQTFDPYPPYKSQTEELVTWINKRLVKAAKNIVYDLDKNLFVTILVYDRADELKYAFTNNPDQLGLSAGARSVVYTEDIVSIDERNGILELDEEILEDDKVYASYYTEESQYELTRIDCNPVNNTDILQQRVVLYIAPEYSGYTLDQSLFYLIVDPLGRIQYSSQPVENSAGTDPGTVKLLAEDFTSAGLPSHAFYYDTTSSEESLASTVSGSAQSVIDGLSFIDKYTVESQMITQVTTGSGIASGVYNNFLVNPRFLVLADITVGESQGVDGFQVFDVRVRGGGIKEDNIQDALEEQSQIVWYWDQIQWRPYPATTSCYIEVPQSVHENHGGRFSGEAIVTAIEKHMQFGGYAVMETYGIDPVISLTSTSSGIISVGWPSYGISTTYNVHTSSTLEGLFSKHNTVVVSDVASGNWYSITGVGEQVPYYIFVEAIDTDGDWSYGPTVKVESAAYTE